MSIDLLLVKSVTAGPEAFSARTEINGYDLNRDIPLPAIPVLDAWVTGKGFTTDCFDLDSHDPELLLEKAADADVIGFHLTYTVHSKVLDAVIRLKKRYPEKIIVIGGPSITNFKEDFFKLATPGFPGISRDKPGRYVDFIVFGQGEIALETILRHKNDKDEIGRLIDSNDASSRGIIYRDAAGKLHVSREPGLVPDLGLLPVPSFALNRGLLPVAFIETARGCPFKCAFCEMPALYSSMQVKERPQIEAEIDILQQLGIKHVVITDPAIYPPKRMEMLSEIFAGRGMVWTGYAKPGLWKSTEPLYSRETLQKARDSGCISLFFGGESASEKTQEMYNKPRLDILRRTEQICKDVGLLSCWSFMVLNPGEQRRDVDDLIELVSEMNPEMAVFSPFILAPDSEMDRQPEKYNIKISNPRYKLDAAKMWAKFSRSAGADKKEKVRRLIREHPQLIRFILKLQMRNCDYFKSKDTGFSLADGAFEMLRLDAILNEKTDIKVGTSNYRLVFEMAARAASN